MVTKLNQIVAIEKGVKGSAGKALTEAYHTIQRSEPLAGITRTYRPKDDDGDVFPDERKSVQVKVQDVLGDVAIALTRLFDVVLTKDVSNTKAFADVKVDDEVIVAQAPVTYLMWLEKQLVDMHTLITKLPTLDPAEDWTYDPAAGAWRSADKETTKTKKVPRNWVKAEATDKHPAQVEVYHEDVVQGYWKTVQFSGAVPADTQRALLDRVNKLIDATKIAREEANSLEVVDQRQAERIFNYLLAPVAAITTTP